MDRPATVGMLAVAHVAARLHTDFLGLAAKERHQKDVLGFKNRVAFKFAHPEAVCVLTVGQPLSRGLNGGLEPTVGLERGVSSNGTGSCPIQGRSGACAGILVGDHATWVLEVERCTESTIS